MLKQSQTAKEIADQLWERILSDEMSPEAVAFYEKLRKTGGYGEDKGGVYYCHPDGRKEYKKR